MAHPEAPEAVDVPAPYTEADAAADISKLFGDDAEEQDAPGVVEEGADADLDLSEDEQAEAEDEPGEPAIATPVSLNADEKKTFAQLPPEAQQAWAASESRRNAQVQDATTAAAEARRVAETRAAQADATAKATYAAQLAAFAQALAPQMPDPALAYENPAEYIAHKAQYDAAKAQHDEFVQQVQGIGAEAFQQASQVDTTERFRDLMTHHSLANPETRADYIRSSLSLVGEIGLDPAAFEQTASATDFRALDKVAEWKTKAERFDQAMSKQMQKVRAGKDRTLRPNAAQPEGSGNRRAFQDATRHLQRTGSVDDAAKALAHIF
jgi:hypothetical protein